MTPRTRAGKPCRERPMNELRVMRLLSTPGHANVCGLIDLFSDDRFLYVVMEFCPGGDLFNRVQRHRHPADGGCRLVEGDAIPAPACAEWGQPFVAKGRGPGFPPHDCPKTGRSR